MEPGDVLYIPMYWWVSTFWCTKTLLAAVISVQYSEMYRKIEVCEPDYKDQKWDDQPDLITDFFS